MAPKESDEDFIKKLAIAVADQRIKEILHGPIDDSIDKIGTQIDKIQEEVITNKDNIEDVQRRIDEFEQRDKTTNIIVTSMNAVKLQGRQ